MPEYMAIFFTFSTTSSHLHPLQVENCDSNSRFVVNEDDKKNIVNSDLKGLSVNSFKKKLLREMSITFRRLTYILLQILQIRVTFTQLR